MTKPLTDYTLEEQHAEIRAIIVYFDARGWDWISLVAYHAAVFTGHWPPRKQAARRAVRHSAGRGAYETEHRI